MTLVQKKNSIIYSSSYHQTTEKVARNASKIVILNINFANPARVSGQIAFLADPSYHPFVQFVESLPRGLST